MHWTLFFASPLSLHHRPTPTHRVPKLSERVAIVLTQQLPVQVTLPYPNFDGLLKSYAVTRFKTSALCSRH